MLLATLGANLLKNMLSDKVPIKAGEKAIRVGQDFQCCLILCLILNYKDIVKMTSNLMVFICVVIYLR